MEYKTKSVILGRTKRQDKESDYPVFLHLFDINNPHKTGEVPIKMVEFPDIHKVEIKGLDILYLPRGNDLVINNLETLKVETEDNHIFISGKQSQ